ncbi:unnamed protein product [Larinioides sclopetarius]|uniref:Uncharacterized protein n=1 Tax=Larinioides sclopetarius TaxID=280406 RepID=A0AAV1ZKW5_9ARAC
MADGDGIRRRREAPVEINYEEALVQVADFVDNNLNNGGAPLARPDDLEWRKQREKTIQKLNELREKLDSTCVRANYGKAVGNGAEIIGIGTTMIGALMSLRGVPSSHMVMNIGNLVHHTGTFIDGTSNVIESIFSAVYLAEIEAVLKKDQELSLPLAEWLNFSRELDTNIEAIFGVSLASEKLSTVLKVFCEFTKFYSSGKGFHQTIGLMREGRYSVYIGTDVKIEKLRMLSEKLSAFPELGDKIRALSTCVGGFQVCRDGVNAYRSIRGVNSSSVVPTLQGGLNPDIPSVKTVRNFCIFQAITLSLSVISLINAASIIKHGTSKYSDAIKQITRCLAWELRQMEEL